MSKNALALIGVRLGVCIMLSAEKHKLRVTYKQPAQAFIYIMMFYVRLRVGGQHCYLRIPQSKKVKTIAF